MNHTFSYLSIHDIAGNVSHGFHFDLISAGCCSLLLTRQAEVIHYYQMRGNREADREKEQIKIAEKQSDRHNTNEGKCEMPMKSWHRVFKVERGKVQNHEFQLSIVTV
eukprot:scaffold2437_cov179-Ochromonas_danica.AAC.4